ncbi:hypothetical protein D3C77_377530 [compost metagenome]
MDAMSGPCACPGRIRRSGMNNALPFAPVLSFTADVQADQAPASMASGSRSRAAAAKAASSITGVTGPVTIFAISTTSPNLLRLPFTVFQNSSPRSAPRASRRGLAAG